MLRIRSHASSALNHQRHAHTKPPIPKTAQRLADGRGHTRARGIDAGQDPRKISKTPSVKKFPTNFPTHVPTVALAKQHALAINHPLVRNLYLTARIL